MAVDNPDVIDIVSVDPKGNTILTIVDHLEWDDKNEHLLILQEKINKYLSVIESGELLEVYPKAKGRQVVIRVVASYDPNANGLRFLEQAKKIIKDAGFDFEFKMHNEK